MKVFGVLAFVLIMPLSVLAERVSTSWALVSGSVTINGAAAPAGTKVTAKVGGEEIESLVVKEAGRYSLRIFQGEAAAGEIIRFEIGNQVAGQVAMVDTKVDGDVNCDLAVTADNSGQVLGDTDLNIVDGDIIQCKNSANPNAVYIVKIVNGKKYIRHIVSLQIFNSYRHLKWDNLIQVQSLDGFTLSGWARVTTGANGAPGQQDRVFEINADQTKHWIDMTAAEFLQHGGSEEAIFNVNPSELALYKEGPAVKLK